MPHISADDLIAAERSERYRIQLDRPNTFPTQQNWEYIICCKMHGLATQLYRKYLLSWLTAQDMRTNYHTLALQYFPQYIVAIDRQSAVSAVYADVTSAPSATIEIINDCRLFDAKKLLELLSDAYSDSDPAPFVADCLAAYQPEYTAIDIADMKRLMVAIEQLPPIGEVKETRTIFGREIRYICPNGHSNPADACFCQTCGVDKYGFTDEQNANIENFKTRVKILERLLR